MDGQLKWLARQAGKPGEGKVSCPLGVVVQHRTALQGLRRPFAPPVGDRGERLAPGVVRVGPEIQAHRRPDVNPLETTVREQRRRRSDRLTGREVHIVWRYGELT